MRAFLVSALFVAMAGVFCVSPAQAELYSFEGTFVDNAIQDNFEGDLFGPLESQAFSGEFDLAGRYFSFETTGYSYSNLDVASFNDFNTMIIVFMTDGKYFDIRETDGAPHTIWIKKGTGMIGGQIETASAVPVPAAVWMLGTGLISLAGLKRKNRATK